MEVVISGMSGRLPGCSNVEEFAFNLFNKKELNSSSDGRYPTTGVFQVLPNRIGRLKDYELFDEEFFGISPNLAEIMDAQPRKALEVTVEAILDSGLKLEQLQNSNRVGIFFSSIHSDIDRHLRPSDLEKRETKNKFDPSTAYYKQIYGEWLAFCLNIKGSFSTYEAACSSGMYSFSDAFQYIKNGFLDIAIVCTTNLNMAPKLILQYLKLGILSETGYCRVMDEKADGYVKSEAVICLILQAYDPENKNLPSVKRIYSTIMNTKCNSDGFKNEGITFPRIYAHEILIRETYKEINLNPINTNYIESHGTGTQVGDIQELICIDKVFNDEETYGKRKKQLYVGSVKSNIGHSEPSSGLCSIVKCLIAFIHNKIPPIVLFEKPNPKIPSILSGRVKPLTETIPINTEYISLSSFGFGGSNSHVILKNGRLTKFSNSKKKFLYQDILTSNKFNLVLFAARTKEGVYNTFKKLATLFRYGELNLKEIFLFNDVVRIQSEIGFNYCGYMILDFNKNVEPVIHVNETLKSNHNLINYINKNVKKHKKKLFYVIPGLGCQWEKMVTSLIKISYFNNRIKQLCNYINPKLNFNFYNVMIGKKENNNEIYNLSNSIYCILAIAIYQISYFDLLNYLEISPDGYLGHSFGELLCFYLDGKCTAEQILEASLVICKLKENKDEFKIDEGSMAVVGLSWQEVLEEIKLNKSINVDAACDNSINCVTVSGPNKDIDEFLNYLTSKNIFNRKIASCGMAFHCKLVNNFYNHLLICFNKIFNSKVVISSKFITTSKNPFKQKNWISSTLDEFNEEVKIGEYFANCILKPVVFKNACEKLVKDIENSNEMVTILELSPRGFLTSLMKSNTSNCKQISYLPSFKPIKELDCEEKLNSNLFIFMSILGSFFECGISPNLNKLFDIEIDSNPIIENNLSISSLVKWNHNQYYALPCYPHFFNTSINENKIDTNMIEYEKLKESNLQFKFPISFLLYLVVKQFLNLQEAVEIDCSSFSLFDIIIYQTFDFEKNILKKLSISFMKISDNSFIEIIHKFVITNNKNKVIAEGNLTCSLLKQNQFSESINNLNKLDKNDFYLQLDLNNYLLPNNLKFIEELYYNKNNFIANILVSNCFEELECLLQVWSFHNKFNPEMILENDTLQIHYLNIALIQNNYLETKQNLTFNKLTNSAKTKNVYINGVQLNSIKKSSFNNELFKNLKNNVKYLGQKINHPSITVIEEDSDLRLRICLIDENYNSDCLIMISKTNLPCLGLLCLPYGYLIAFYLLKKKFELKINKTIFIDCEDDLAIVLGLCDLLKKESNCKVFVYLNEKRKQSFLPKSDNIHVLTNENSDGIDCNILRLTNGKGVELVISSAKTKEHFQEAVNCLSINGKFIKINNKLSLLNVPLGMSIFLKNIDFVGITLEELNLNQILHSYKETTIKNIFESIDCNLITKLSKLDKVILQDIFTFKIIKN